MSGNEASAIGSLRAINSGGGQLLVAAGQWRAYAIPLPALVDRVPGPQQGFISPDRSGSPASPQERASRSLAASAVAAAARLTATAGAPDEIT